MSRCADDAALRAVGAEVAHDRAGVQVLDGGNLVALQELLAVLAAAPVAGNRAELTNHQAFNVRTRRFVVVGVGAVVADLRIGQNNNLAGIGGVGEDFLLTGDGSIENNFPVTFAFGAVAFAAEDAPIFQRKDSLHSCSRSGFSEF